MFTEAGVDTGPMLLRAQVPIGPEMNAEELARELSVVGAKLLIETLVKLEADESGTSTTGQPGIKPGAHAHKRHGENRLVITSTDDSQFGARTYSLAGHIHNLQK